VSDDQPAAELVMPFVAVASHGGPFDDVSYAAGFEAGMLDALLGHALTKMACDRIERTILQANTLQADLIAMRHGWAMVCRPWDDTWTEVVFTRDRDQP
jgi:hypothetical protein